LLQRKKQEKVKTDFNLLAIGTLLMASFALGSVATILATVKSSQETVKSQKVICDSGNEFADEALIRDPYYAYSWKCNAGDVNGPQVIVEVID
jgi:hypothetical protein